MDQIVKGEVIMDQHIFKKILASLN